MNLTPRIFNVVAVVSLAPATGPHRLVLAKLALGSLLIVSLTAACALPWQERIYTPGDDGVTLPSKIVDVRGVYPQEARDAKIEGVVRLTGVVHPDGTVDDIRIVQSLDEEFGLDDQARLTLSQWRFEPAMRNGVPVPVRMEFFFRFTLD